MGDFSVSTLTQMQNVFDNTTALDSANFVGVSNSLQEKVVKSILVYNVNNQSLHKLSSAVHHSGPLMRMNEVTFLHQVFGQKGSSPFKYSVVDV